MFNASSLGNGEGIYEYKMGKGGQALIKEVPRLLQTAVENKDTYQDKRRL